MMKRIVVVAFFLRFAAAMLIPEDAEMLEGYGPVLLQQISPEDEYFEARSLSGGSLLNAIRNKREINYNVKESDGLVSHFRPNTVSAFAKKGVNSGFLQPNEGSFHKLKEWLKNKFPREQSSELQSSEMGSFNLGNIIISRNRRRRSAENEQKTKVNSAKNEGNNNQRIENLPIASKLTKNSNGFTSTPDNPSSAALIGKFTRSPFEYSKIQHEEDSMALDSQNMNEGMKSRTPRVNFVTQKKSLDHDDAKTSSTKSDFYKSPPLLRNSQSNTNEASTSSSSERYPDRSSTSKPSSYPDYKDRGTNGNRYDDRYIEDMYPPPPEIYDPMNDYNGPHDPYMRPPPYSGYNNGYPGNRYDIPDYRDYPPMYGNDIDDRYYMRSDMMPPSPPRKRTIYYAYLPEVVRSPPSVDLRYRTYDHYDPYYSEFYNPYETMMNNPYRRPYSERPIERAPLRYDSRSPRPMKISSDGMMRNNSSVKEKRFDQERSYDSKISMHPYYNRRPSEYDSYFY